MEGKHVELKINNDLIIGMLDRYAKTSSFSKKEEQNYFKSTGVKEQGEYIFMGYAMDMVNNSLKTGNALDLTYESLKYIPQAMQAFIQDCRKKGLILNSLSDTVARGFAAYLTILGMNEHNCDFKVYKLGTSLMPPPESEYPLWANLLRIKTGTRREVDFLPAVTEGMKCLPGKERSLLTLSLDPVYRAYKSAFRINLTDHGLTNIALEA